MICVSPKPGRPQSTPLTYTGGEARFPSTVTNASRKPGAIDQRQSTWSEENPKGRWRSYDLENLLALQALPGAQIEMTLEVQVNAAGGIDEPTARIVLEN